MAIQLLKNYIALYSDQVPYHPSPLSSKSLLRTNLSSNKPLLSLPISVFFSLSLVQVGKFFHRLIPYLVFLLSPPIIGLKGFLPATWPFKTHQLPYGVRMFLVVSRFSSPVSLVGLRSFLPGSLFPSTISHSTELASKEKGNCNNVTSERRVPEAEVMWQQSSRTLPWSVLTSTVTPQPIKLPLGAAVSSLPTHLFSNALDFLLWQGRMTRKDDNISSYALDHLHSTPYYLRSRKVFRAVGTICASPTCCGMRIIISEAALDSVESERLVGRNQVCFSLVQTSALSSRVYWLAGKGLPLVCHWYWSGLLARWQRSVIRMSSGLMTKDSHQQVIVTPELWLNCWRSWWVTRDNQTWQWSRLEWFWSNWELGSLPCSSK